MLLYAATIFLSAFLLFQVQPLIAKIILPWFGGSAAVLVLMVVAFLLRNQLSSSKSPTAATGPVVSLAILPLRNASGWVPPSHSTLLLR